jgi:hypothetical protein
MAYKGIFKPSNPQKYIGNPANITYRSRWELLFMQKADTHPEIIRWASEEIAIPYVSPGDEKIHRYFPDFYIEVLNADKIKRKYIIEIKPKKQTIPPAKPKTNNRKSRIRYVNEGYTYAINKAKWEAARRWCEDKGIKFIIMTENELGLTF